MGCERLISPATRFLRLHEPLRLESEDVLRDVRVAFRTWGASDRAGDNAVLICHALTGSADADSWWGGLIGPGRALDPRHDFIVCSNILGSCYGTTGPANLRPGTGHRWGADFPAITVRDMVAVQARLLDALGVHRLRLVIGGSLGGMQVLEWAAMFPAQVEAIAPIAVSGRHSAWCIALSEAQRAAIRSDPRWRDGRYLPDDPPAGGLAAARMIAMCTYRSRESLEARFGRERGDAGVFEVERYLRHQGRKLIERFDANCYVALTHAMDGHDLGRGRGGYGQVLRALRARALIVAIESDVLYPPVEQAELADLIPGAELARLPSIHGHDAFLIEIGALNELVGSFRRRASAVAGRKAS